MATKHKPGERTTTVGMLWEVCDLCGNSFEIAAHLVGLGRMCSDCNWDLACGGNEVKPDTLTLRQRYGKGKTGG